MPNRRRWAAFVPAALLCLSACAHQQTVPPSAVEAMQSDSPAISPWAEPPPNVSIEEDPAYTETPAR
jgi:hypothetical protein